LSFKQHGSHGVEVMRHRCYAMAFGWTLTLLTLFFLYFFSGLRLRVSFTG